MSGKGSKRRRSRSPGLYRDNHDYIFVVVECPGCKEIELRPTGVDNMWECRSCHHEEQMICS